MLRICLAILLTFAFLAHAVDSVDTCEPRLGGGHDLYYNAFYQLMNSGKLTDADLRRVVDSHDGPINPFSTYERRTGHLAGRDLFAQYVKMERIQKEWPSTRQHLEALLRAREKNEKVREEARRATFQLFGITPVWHVPTGPFHKRAGPGVALLNHPDGNTYIAWVERNSTLKVTRLDGLEPVLSEALPFGGDSFWRFSWHQDRDGGFSLYLAGVEQIPNSSHVPESRYFRRAFNSVGRIEELPLDWPQGRGFPFAVASLGPEHLLVETSTPQGTFEVYNIASGTPKLEDVPPRWKRGEAAAVAGGLLSANQAEQTQSNVFALPSGKGIRVTATEDKIVVEGFQSTPLVYPVEPIGWTFKSSSFSDVSVYELPGGRTFLALARQSGLGVNLSVYELGAQTEPIYRLRVNSPRISDFHWFRSPSDELLLAFFSNERGTSLKLVDPLAKLTTDPDRQFSAYPLGWFTDRNNTYFWVDEGEGVQIYKLYTRTR